MKIKTDFVTNSSSTCYIAYIPDFVDIPSKEEMEEEYQLYNSCEEEKQDIYQGSVKLFHNLIYGDHVYCEDLGTDPESFFLLAYWLKNKGFVLADHEDHGGSGYDMIIPISLEKIMEIRINHGKEIETMASIVNGGKA